MRKSIHVTYQKQDGMWHVVSGKNGSDNGSYSTQKEAMQEGKKLAMETSSEFCIHGKDGKIRQSLSYGNDPRDSMKNKKSNNNNNSKSSRSKNSSSSRSSSKKSN